MESSTQTPLDNLIGQVVGNRFQVESVLGVGAMGVVFRARATGERVAAPVALKVVLPERGQQRIVPRFLRGTRLAAQVKHPHVVETLAYGHVGSEREGYFVAMELVEGVSLGRLMSAALDVGAICTLMSQVLDALAFMHARGILHRDIKPDNILVSRGEGGELVCKISDFGIAAETRHDATMLTQPGMVVGTPLYMAPEQMSGQGLDTPALDLYPVGAMLYEFLGGAPPFASHSMAAVMAKLVDEPPPLVPRAGLVVPPGLSEVIMRLIARRPEDRYLLAADARGALAGFCGPARMPASAWQELVGWQPRTWEEAGALPAGWGQGPVVLAAGTGDQAPVVAEAEGELPLVGRDEELRRIERIAVEAEAGQARAVLLRAGVGLGKSALLDEVATRLAASGRFLVVRIPLPPSLGLCEGLRQAMDSALGTTGRSVGHVRQVIDDFLRRHGEHERREVEDLVSVLRPDSPGCGCIEQGAMFALVHRYLRRFSRSRPVLLIADDVQRGGPDALAFLEFLLFQAGFEPFPLLVLASMSEEEASEPIPGGQGRLTRFEGSVLHTISLPPLDEELLASALSGHLRVALPRARSIARRAAGNPMFAVHLARAVSSATTSAGDAQVQAGAVERVPRALHELLELSLGNRLAQTTDPDGHRQVLEAVALLGPSVDTALLEAFLDGEITPDRLDRILDACLDLHLLAWRELRGAEIVALEPEVLRDVLLAGVNPRRARRMHLRAIEVRTRLAGARVDAQAGALGDHCEAAGRLDQAVDWWLRGQRHEMDGGNLLLGVEWGIKALAAMAGEDPRRGPCAITLGRVLLDTGDLERAAEVLRPVVDGPDADLAVRAGEVLGDVYENLGRNQDWDRLIEQLTARAGEVGQSARVSLHLARAIWLNHRLRSEEGEQEARQALAGAAPGEQAQRAAQRLVFSALFRDDLEEAESMARRAYEESGDRVDLRARSLRVLSLVAVSKGEIEQARAHLQALLDLCRRSGLLGRIPLALFELGELDRNQGRMEQARSYFASAARAARDLRLAAAEIFVALRVIACDIEEGRVEGVMERIRELEARGQATMSFVPKFSLVLKAWMHAIEGRGAQAIELLEDSLGWSGVLTDSRLALILERVVACVVESMPEGMTEAQAAIIHRVLEVMTPLEPLPWWQERLAVRRRLLERLRPAS